MTITPYLMLPTGGSSVEINANEEETVTEFDRASLKEVKFKPFTVTLREGIKLKRIFNSHNGRFFFNTDNLIP
ncbi:MAG: hypothetical protein ACQEWV_29590 [Bacillota bacterium]